MKGHEAIIEARTRGYKPSGVVSVDVGQSVAWQAFLMGENITESFPGRVTMLNDTTPLHRLRTKGPQVKPIAHLSAFLAGVLLAVWLIETVSRSCPA